MPRKRQKRPAPTILEVPVMYGEHKWIYLKDSYGTVRKCRVVGDGREWNEMPEVRR